MNYSIFTKDDVGFPVQAEFDWPMGAHGVQKCVGRELARTLLASAVDLTFDFDAVERPQAAEFTVYREAFRIDDDRAAPVDATSSAVLRIRCRMSLADTGMDVPCTIDALKTRTSPTGCDS